MRNLRQRQFRDKTAYVGGQDFRPKLRFSCSVATALQRFVPPCIFCILNTEWKWKWIMNVYRQDCSKFEFFWKVALYICNSPWWTLELLTELTKFNFQASCVCPSAAGGATRNICTLRFMISAQIKTFWSSAMFAQPNFWRKGSSCYYCHFLIFLLFGPRR